MAGLLLTRLMAEQCADQLPTIAAQTGTELTPILFPADESPLDASTVSAIDLAYVSPDLFRVGVERVWQFMQTLESAPNLRWAHLGWAGTDHPRFAEFLDRGVQISNSPGAAAEPIAHSAMAGLLSLARRFPFFARQQREHRWERLPAELVPPDLGTQTLVIFGLGSIGRELARLARPFGIRVIGVRRSPRRDDDEVDDLIHPDQLDGGLPEADWLAITSPLTAATLGAISAARLDLLPPGAHLLNVARGKIVDEEALVARLESGAIAGAYLDVVSEEPLTPDSPLWDLPNVILTPHSSWVARGNPERARQIFLTNLACVLRGEDLPQAIRRD